MTHATKEKIKIVVIVGPTASGKSALAEKIAADFNGVILNADARQVYQGLPILTAAAPSDATHKLYQFLSLDAPFSFVQYTAVADAEIAAAQQAQKLPLIVGGTGLYVDALLGEANAAPQALPEIRARVRALNIADARAYLLTEDPAATAHIDMKNPRRVARALEVLWETGRSITTFEKIVVERYDALFIGWNPGREIVLKNIRSRVLAGWGGSVAEVRDALAAGYQMSAPGMQSIGVAEIAAFLGGQLSVTAAQELLIMHTAQYAKRQMTWFKRNKKIVWYTDADEVWHSLHDFLHNDSPAR